MAKRKTALDKAITALEAEIDPLQQQITIRLAAIQKLREQDSLARRKKTQKLDRVTKAGPMEVAGSSGD